MNEHCAREESFDELLQALGGEETFEAEAGVATEDQTSLSHRTTPILSHSIAPGVL
jgi:hypothetical protein